EHLQRVSADQARLITEISLFYFPVAYGAAIALVFVARGVRALRERQGGMITITYPNRQVRVPKGLSVLETSLRFKIPHASVCGGRPRPSTFRIPCPCHPSKLAPPSGPQAFPPH